MGIISTKEICRVNYDSGGWMKLMKQIYSDSSPFYWITESHLIYDSSVESSSENILEIINYMEKRIKCLRDTLHIQPKDNTDVRNIYSHHIKITKLFIDKIKIQEGCHENRTGNIRKDEFERIRREEL